MDSAVHQSVQVLMDLTSPAVLVHYMVMARRDVSKYHHLQTTTVSDQGEAFPVAEALADQADTTSSEAHVQHSMERQMLHENRPEAHIAFLQQL